MVFQLKTFCGCQSVEAGSRTIAIVQVVMGAVYTGLSVYNEMIHGSFVLSPIPRHHKYRDLRLVSGMVGGLVLLVLGLFLYLGVRTANVPVLILWIFANILAIIFLVSENRSYISSYIERFLKSAINKIFCRYSKRWCTCLRRPAPTPPTPTTSRRGTSQPA